jgi:hypothetical protein
VATARAEDGSTCKLYSNQDNWAALQSFVDAHTTIQLPAGEWWISKCLNLKNNSQTLAGRGADNTTLKRISSVGGPVVGIAGDGAWEGSSGYGRADNITVRKLSLWQTDESTTNCKCFFNNDGDNLLLENLRVIGSSYEGIVSGSNCAYVRLSHIEAWNCGNGGPAYALSTAGINATSDQLIIEDFRTVGCGQGLETGNQHIVIRRGHISSPGAGSPQKGINIGSTGHGVYDVVIEDCIISGYDSAFGCGNGIGRLCGIFFRRNKIYDEGDGAAAVEFMGGLENNLVTGEQNRFEGPDLYGSEITDNEFYISAPHSESIIYNTGPANIGNPNVHGREALLVARNKITYVSGDTSLQTSPIIGFAGNITGNITVQDNKVYGMPAAPSRGDLQTYTNNQNASIPGMPNLSYARNYAFDTNGKRLRSFVVNIEGA